MAAAAELAPTASWPDSRRGSYAVSAGRALGLVSLAAVLANATWFSATAVVPALERQWGLEASGAGLIVAVQQGFVAGSVGAALLNLPDRLEPRRLIASAAIAAAAANAGLLLAGGLASALPSRFLVGVALAGVYAPGVRSHPSRTRPGIGRPLRRQSPLRIRARGVLPS